MRNWFKKFAVTFLTVFVLGSFLIPSFSFAQGTATTVQANPTGQVLNQTGSGFQQSLPSLPACGLLGGEGTFEGCFVRLFYYAILYPSSWVAALAGQIFDYFIAYTLNSESYHSGGFVEQGWRVVRDIVNASFIFILLYVAITFIVNAKSSNLERVVTRIILIAIVINFSLFMTRAIIDAGNILGRVFYERIVVENDVLSQTTNYTTISAALVAKVEPQKLLTPDMFRKKYSGNSAFNSTQQNTIGTFNNSTDNANLQSGDIQFEVGAGFMILIILIASAVNIALAWVFFSVSIFLVARTLGLWLMMIFSPIAFATVSIPFLKIPKYGFGEWLNKTVTLSFLVVVFMFFLYLTIMFLDITNDTILSVATDGVERSTVNLIMSVVVPAMAVLFLLMTAKNQAKSMAGEFGGMVGKALKVGTTFALGGAGLALGATAGLGAVAGRQIGGRLGASMAAGADTSKWSGRAQKRLGNYLANSKYDARNINIPKPAKSILNVGKSGLSYATDGALSSKDFNLTQLNTFGKPSDKSYVQRKEDRVKKIVSEAKEFAPTDNTSVQTKDSSGNDISMSVSEAQKILDRKRIDIKQANDYEDKIKDRDKQKKNLDEMKKDYDTALREYGLGKITASELDDTKTKLVDAKKAHEDKIKEIKDLEKLWSEDEKILNNTKKALAKKKTEFFKNYSKTIDDWAAFPDAGLTYRYEASKDAADEIENLGIKEEKKEEKKDDKKDDKK